MDIDFELKYSSNEKQEITTDFDAINNGYISITPLSTNGTDFETFQKIKSTDEELKTVPAS